MFKALRRSLGSMNKLEDPPAEDGVSERTIQAASKAGGSDDHGARAGTSGTVTGASSLYTPGAKRSDKHTVSRKRHRSSPLAKMWPMDLWMCWTFCVPGTGHCWSHWR